MKPATIEKLFAGDFSSYSILRHTQRFEDSNHDDWTMVLVNGQVGLIQEFPEDDGFEVWTPAPGNSVGVARSALGLDQQPEIDDADLAIEED